MGRSEDRGSVIRHKSNIERSFHTFFRTNSGKTMKKKNRNAKYRENGKIDVIDVIR